MNKGLIYRLYCTDDNIDESYIGSTTNLKKRIYKHKYCCNNINSKGYNHKLYQFIRYNEGFNNFEFEILEDNILFNNRIELNRIEGEYIKKNNNCLNSDIAGRTDKEYYETNKQKIKQYYESNKKEFSEKNKQYYKENLEKSKQFRNDNKEKIKKYYESNKQKISEKNKIKFTCECGSIIRVSDKAIHNKSKKHQKFINSLILSV